MGIQLPSVPPSRQIIAGNNMNGGGDLSADITLNVNNVSAASLTRNTNYNIITPNVAQLIDFEVVKFDTENYFSFLSPTRLTINGDINFVSIFGQMEKVTFDGTYIVLVITQYNALGAGKNSWQIFETTISGLLWSQISTGIVAVEIGDYFTISIQTDGNTDPFIASGCIFSIFQIK